ncbi:MAG: hypothetical protein AAFR34_08170, partial [Pseudomonadota bacterium]
MVVMFGKRVNLQSEITERKVEILVAGLKRYLGKPMMRLRAPISVKPDVFDTNTPHQTPPSRVSVNAPTRQLQTGYPFWAG